MCHCHTTHLKHTHPHIPTHAHKHTNSSPCASWPSLSRTLFHAHSFALTLSHPLLHTLFYAHSFTHTLSRTHAPIPYLAHFGLLFFAPQVCVPHRLSLLGLLAFTTCLHPTLQALQARHESDLHEQHKCMLLTCIPNIACQV